MSDVIFWYTGWIAWAIIALVLAGVVGAGIIRSYTDARSWKRFWVLFGAPKEMREAVRAGIDCVDGSDKSEILNQIVVCGKAVDKHMFEQYAEKLYSEHDKEFRCSTMCLYGGEECKVIHVSHMGKWRVYELRRIRDDNVILNVTSHDIEKAE